MTNGSGGSPVGARFAGFVPRVTIGSTALPGQSGPVIAPRLPVLFHGTPTPPLASITGAAERKIRTSDFVADAICGGSERHIGRHLVARLAAGRDEDAPARTAAGNASGSSPRVMNPTMALAAVAPATGWSAQKNLWVHTVLHLLKPLIENPSTHAEEIGADTEVAKALAAWYDRFGEGRAGELLRQLQANDPSAWQRCWGTVTDTPSPPAYETQLALTAVGGGAASEVRRAVSARDISEAMQREQAATTVWFVEHVLPTLRDAGNDLRDDASPAEIVEALFTFLKSYYFIGDQLRAIFAKETDDERFATDEVHLMLFTGLEAIAGDSDRVPGQRGYQHLLAQRLARTAAEHVSGLTMNPFDALVRRYGDVIRALAHPAMPESIQWALSVTFGVPAAQWDALKMELQATPLYALALRPDAMSSEELALRELRTVMTTSAAPNRHGTQFGLRATSNVPAAWNDAAARVDASLQDRETAVSVIRWIRTHQVILFDSEDDAPQFARDTQPYAAARELLWKGGTRLLGKLRRAQLLIDVLASVYQGGMSNRDAFAAVRRKLTSLHKHPPVGMSFQEWAFYRGLVGMVLREVEAGGQSSIQLAVDYHRLVSALGDAQTPQAVREFVMAGLQMPMANWGNTVEALIADPLFLAGDIQSVLTTLAETHHEALSDDTARAPFLECWGRLESLLAEWRRLTRSEDSREQRNVWALYILFGRNPELLKTAKRAEYRALLSEPAAA